MGLMLQFAAVLWSQISIPGLNDVPTTAIPVNVSVTGMVKTPGSYYLTNMNRVSDAIYRASQMTVSKSEMKAKTMMLPTMGDRTKSQRAQTETAENNITILSFEQDSSLRTVILRRHGKDATLDLMQFIRKGDLNQNPYLQDGDVIILQPIHKQVTLEGAVFQPGKYEILPNETLGDVISLAQGLKSEVDMNQGLICRYQADGKSITTIHISPAELQNGGTESNLSLEDGDRIVFASRTDYHADNNVQVIGEVKYPGTYAIQDSISLLDLMHQCGGPTDKADLRNAQAFNNARAKAYDPSYSFLEMQNFETTNPSDQDYLRMKTRQPFGLIAVNIEDLWKSQDKKKDIYLHNDDILNIPEINLTITIIGQVENPGVYDLNKSGNWENYITQAGGYGWHANLKKVRIIRANSGNWVKPDKNTTLYAGDTIFVPSKADRTNWDIFKETLLVTSQIVTTLFAIKSLTQ